jgi:hypothetical protein
MMGRNAAPVRRGARVATSFQLSAGADAAFLLGETMPRSRTRDESAEPCERCLAVRYERVRAPEREEP